MKKKGPMERAKLLAKRYKVDSSEPGAIYEKAKLSPQKRIAIQGLI